MKKFMLMVLLITFVLSSNAFAGEKISLLGFRNNDVAPRTISTIRELFNLELSNLGMEVYISEEYNTYTSIESVKSFESKTNLSLFGSVTQLNDKYIIGAFLYDHSKNEQIYTDQLTSLGLEDIDLVIKRLAESIYYRKSAAELINKSNVSLQETEEPRRRKNFYTAGGLIGYTFPFNNSYGSSEPIITIAPVALYEMQNWIVEGKYTWAMGENGGTFGADISLLYLLSQTDFSPYVGGGLGIHWFSDIEQEHDDEDYYSTLSGDGFNLNFGGGLIAFQTYDFRLMVDLRYNIAFTSTNDESYWYDDDFGSEHVKDELGTQHGVSLTFGLTRKITRTERPSCCLW